MTWDLFVQLVGHLAWPIFLVIVAFVFRAPIAQLISRMREIEAGGAKIKIDPAQLEKVATQVAQGRMSPKEAAKRLEESAFDEKEYRILRALVDEEQGRRLAGYLYQSIYRDAFVALQRKGLIQHQKGKYYLTEIGKPMVNHYLSDVLKSY